MTAGTLPSITSPFRQKLGGWGEGDERGSEQGVWGGARWAPACIPPEVNGAEPDEHPDQQRGFLPQHDGPVVIEPPAGCAGMGWAPMGGGGGGWEGEGGGEGIEAHLVVRESRSAVVM